MEAVSVVDAHVHFWDPGLLDYPWLDDLPSLRRSFLPADYSAAIGEVPVERVIFVEANADVRQVRREVEAVERLADTDPRIAGIIAFADCAQGFDSLIASPRLKGIRQNIQGQPRGFALQPDFVRSVREVGARGFTFDLCVTHDQ